MNKGRIKRVTATVLKSGILSPQDAAEVEQGTLVASMVGPAS